MKDCIKISCFFISLFFFLPLINATCSIGATPLGESGQAKPGEEVLVTWNFYNLYGDRITHVIVSKAEGPDWEMRYEPSLHEESYDISGVIVNKTENLAIETSSVVLSIPKNPPEGISYVKHPSKEGYIPVKTIKIYIKIPEDAKVWETKRFVFEAKGECFSEPGTVTPAIATQLKVDITPGTDFYEKEAVQKSRNSNFLSAITGAVIGKNGTTNVFVLTTVVLVIILLVLLIKLRKKHKINNSFN